MKLKKLLNEIFVAPRRYKTYMPYEWDYPLLVKLFDDLYGQDLNDTLEGQSVYKIFL